jgi:hypothetical protein
MLLRFFVKVRSQAIQYGPWYSLRPSSETRQGPRTGMVMGRGQAYYDFRNRSGAGWFNNRAEAGDLKFSTHNAGGVDEREIGTCTLN